MITILPNSNERMLAVNVNGKLRRNDYSTVEDEIKLRVQNGVDDIRMLIRIQQFEGTSLRALVEELQMTSYAKHFERLAVVSDNDWWEASTATIGRAAGELLGVDVKHFEPGQDSAAWEWVTS
jgi:hypothetical protein